MGGVVSLVLALAVLTVLLATGISPWWRLLLFPLFAGAGSGFFQWRDKTGVGLAARGSRQLTENIEKIEDTEELKQVRRQARKVQTKGSIAGLVMTLITLLIP
jgi:hypothetical protein